MKTSRWWTVFTAACAERPCQRARKRIKASGKWCSCRVSALFMSALHNTVQKNDEIMKKMLLGELAGFNSC